MDSATDDMKLTDLSIAEAAAALRRGDVSPEELVDAHLARIEEVNPGLNAFVEVTVERAREDARRAGEELAGGHDRGPLHGVPIGLKDLIDTAGITTAGGAAVYRGRIPTVDATVAARLRDAGAVLVGKTNTHELAFGVTTNNPHFGPTRNPWDRTRIPGGSSGGSAAAVVARIAAGALGTDTGGSVRIPASMCGCVGLKPTFGLVPTTGVIALSALADHVGPITRTVEDAALLLQAIAGYDPADPATLPIPVPDYAGGLGGDLRGLRIGVPRTTAWTLLDDEVARTAEAALVVLGDLGADLVDVELPAPITALGGPGSIGLFGVAVEESRQAHRDAWDSRPEDFGPDLAMLYSAPPLTGAMVVDTLALLRGYAAAIRSALVSVDLLASPTVPVAAPPIGADVVEIDGSELPFIAVAIANTAPYNMARLPAISVPCGFTTDQLPVGLQLAGRPLDEPTVLRAAHAYERATDWTRRRPPALPEPT